MLTVNEVIAEINFCARTITELEEYANDDHTICGAADAMRDAIGLIEKYMDELGRKQVK